MSTCVTGVPLEGWPVSGLQRQKCLILIITNILNKNKGWGWGGGSRSCLDPGVTTFGRVTTDAQGNLVDDGRRK